MALHHRIAPLAAMLAVAVPRPALTQEGAGDGVFRIAAVGDAIITRALSPYREPEFLRMIELMRGQDAAFANLEMLFHDYEPWPAAQSGGTYMRGAPEMAKELVWAGIDMVGLANNHTGDYGVDGMRLTIKHVRDAGLVSAGAGENLYEAREAKFLETQDGRVALISTASSFTPHSLAGKPKGAVRGRPGLNPLRTTNRPPMVSRDQLERMRGLLREIGQNVPQSGDQLNVFGTTVRVGDPRGVPTSEPNPEDVEEMAAVVRNAKGVADYVFVTIHTHQGAPNAMPPDFLVTFARAMIDAGADVFVGHGPHFLKGIEIYKGRPIFYSLGDFIFQNETLLRLPYENYMTYGLGESAWVQDFNAARYANDTQGFPTNREIWESVIAIPAFRGGELISVELHPITLGFGQPRSVRGRPMLAAPELGRKIISDLIERSRSFGTAIEWRDREGIGVVRLPGRTDGNSR
ncbi:MAG: CapA family protein [Gemmatimonadetes bacterium]|nr:CapA family protein [Gemmatimonadota bacterium]